MTSPKYRPALPLALSMCLVMDWSINVAQSMMTGAETGGSRWMPNGRYSLGYICSQGTMLHRSADATETEEQKATLWVA